jgi:hypothetical protein
MKKIAGLLALLVALTSFSFAALDLKPNGNQAQQQGNNPKNQKQKGAKKHRKKHSKKKPSTNTNSSS